MRDPFLLPADTDEALDVIVPRRDVGVADRPVDRDAVAQIGLEIEIGESVRLTAPQQGTTADVITAHPVKALRLRVRVVDVVDKPVRGRRVRGVAGAPLFFLARPGRRSPLVATGEFPRLGHGGRVLAVLHIAPSLEHEGLEALFGQFLGGPATTDAGADHDRVVGLGVHA